MPALKNIYVLSKFGLQELVSEFEFSETKFCQCSPIILEGNHEDESEIPS